MCWVLRRATPLSAQNIPSSTLRISMMLSMLYLVMRMSGGWLLHVPTGPHLGAWRVLEVVEDLVVTAGRAEAAARAQSLSMVLRRRFNSSRLLALSGVRDRGGAGVAAEPEAMPGPLLAIHPAAAPSRPLRIRPS